MPTDIVKSLAQHAGGQFAPMLANVCVYNTDRGRRAQVGNGRYWVDTPADGLPPTTVNADKLAALIGVCKSEPEINVTDQFLTVKSGKVRGRVQLVQDQYPRTTPDPPDAKALPGITSVLKALLPFAAEDASRPWATSVCLRDGYGYATNNVVIARHPLQGKVRNVINIPSLSVQSIVERGDVTTIGHSDTSVTFYYEDGSWVRSLLVSGDWPTAVADNYMAALKKKGWQSVNPELGKMLTTAAAVSDARLPTVQFDGDGFKLTDDTFAVDGMSPVPEEGRVTAKMAALVFNTADEVQWHTPKKNVHAFRRGELVGVFGGTT